MTRDAAGEPARRAGAGFRRDVAAMPVEATEARRALQKWALAQGIPDELVIDVTIATYEAMANVITHAYADNMKGAMTVAAVRTGDVLTVRVADNGQWARRPGGPDGGRGLHLMRALAETTFSADSGGTTVTLRWSWPTQDERAQ
ncbi:ATP-binding protein [Amycolatopsis thermoflava]